MSDIAIKVEGLSKLYKIGKLQRRHDTLRDRIADARVFNLFKRRNGHGGSNPTVREGSAQSAGPSPFAPGSSPSALTPLPSSDLLWALRDVSFEVRRGEVVGIIGRNGAGKSTLLKILSRITEPTEGYADINGRIASLLEVGTGFHPELTGRENIYLNGAILGMKKAEIESKFDEIVSFADVEKFIDTPVKHYSSGMYLRLAFAVAAHLDPEILLVDEVLAVGDAVFQKKCLGKMRDVANEGRTVLFVSHNMGAIAQLCQKGILLNEGKVVYEGASQSAVQTYLDSVGGHMEASKAFAENPGTPIQLTCIHAADSLGELVSRFDIADEICLRLRYTVRRTMVGLNLAVVLFRNGVEVLCSFDSDCNPDLLTSRKPGDYDCLISLPRRILKAGLYSVSLAYGVMNRGTMESHREVIAFRIEELSEDTSMRGYSETRAGVLLGPLPWKEFVPARSFNVATSVY